MAWLNTDWSKELNQVQDRINLILDEKVEPLLERNVEKASAEVATMLAKAEFELRDNTNHFLSEIESQRHQMVKEMKGLIRYAAIAALIVVVVSAVVIKIIGML